MSMLIKVKFNFEEPLIDKKINGVSWMVKMTIGDYLKMIDMDGNVYQRDLQSLSFYKKLIDDLLNDTIMPPVSVVYPECDINLKKGLNPNNKFIILDGLQRTNCLLQCIKLINDGKKECIFKTVKEFEAKEIYVEIWEKLDLKNILYKMLVLNTGQKKMDYDHQLDILSTSVRAELENYNIKYYISKDKKKIENKQDNYALSTITSALVSFISQIPIRNKKNAAEFLFNNFELDLNSGDGEKTLDLINSEETYKYLNWVLVDLNSLLDEKYGAENPLKRYDTFLIALMGSLGFCYAKKPELLKRKIKVLEESFVIEADPIKLKQFEIIYNEFKTGIGDKRRRFIFDSLNRYFLNDVYDEFIWEKEYYA